MFWSNNNIHISKRGHMHILAYIQVWKQCRSEKGMKRKLPLLEQWETAKECSRKPLYASRTCTSVLFWLWLLLREKRFSSLLSMSKPAYILMQRESVWCVIVGESFSFSSFWSVCISAWLGFTFYSRYLFGCSCELKNGLWWDFEFDSVVDESDFCDLVWIYDETMSLCCEWIWRCWYEMMLWYEWGF